MKTSNGYSLDQLLAWTMEDRLIDGYEQHAESLVILEDGKRQELPFEEARTYLKQMFARSPRGVSREVRNES